eukprot:CAMPEP_0177713636 /NCGR_PEP_ID=MMETSP0484_2-20121128/13045_1 /TAXON_ID=354590 /ORGANISM="Rhodomonas lens, Strain RHODO" /LENGTH=443 /DNA_ID=CAMNT_0019225539 /DNA_START=336 /DNA_END=1666 /DNA_ORIENTATION=+
MNRYLASLALLALIRPAATVLSSEVAASSWMNRNLKLGKATGLLQLRGGEMQRTVSLEQQLHPPGDAGKSCHNCNMDKRSLATADLELGDVIGFGSFSTVHGAKRRDGRNVAVKKIRVPERDGERDPVIVKRMQREIHILAETDHPNIVKLVDVFHDDDEAVVSIVLERCMGGELFDFVNDFQTFHANGERSWLRTNTTVTELVREEHIAVLVRQILLAVEHLHSRNIVHRDLKLENVMLDEPFTTEREPRVKLIDFGFSRDHEGRRDMFTACGSTLYIAPEVLTAKERGVGYGRECDMWAVGVMTFILLCCKPPFMGPTSYDIGCAIKAGNYQYPEYALVSAEARDLISRLLEMDPLRRISANQAAQPPLDPQALPGAGAGAEADDVGVGLAAGLPARGLAAACALAAQHGSDMARRSRAQPGRASGQQHGPGHVRHGLFVT